MILILIDDYVGGVAEEGVGGGGSLHDEVRLVCTLEVGIGNGNVDVLTVVGDGCRSYYMGGYGAVTFGNVGEASWLPVALFVLEEAVEVGMMEMHIFLGDLGGRTRPWYYMER